jgi:hypothetical protein
MSFVYFVHNNIPVDKSMIGIFEDTEEGLKRAKQLVHEQTSAALLEGYTGDCGYIFLDRIPLNYIISDPDSVTELRVWDGLDCIEETPELKVLYKQKRKEQKRQERELDEADYVSSSDEDEEKEDEDDEEEEKDMSQN